MTRLLQVLNSLIMPYFSSDVKHAIMSTPAGARSILDAAVSGLLQARLYPTFPSIFCVEVMRRRIVMRELSLRA
jgi:hypothetical protein